MTICDACFSEVGRRLPITREQFERLSPDQVQDVINDYQNRYMVCGDCYRACNASRNDPLKEHCNNAQRRHKDFLKIRVISDRKMASDAKKYLRK